MEPYSATEAARWFALDTLWARGPVRVARHPAITRDLYVWDGLLTLYFSPDGRLTHLEAHLSAQSPL